MVTLELFEKVEGVVVQLLLAVAVHEVRVDGQRRLQTLL